MDKRKRKASEMNEFLAGLVVNELIQNPMIPGDVNNAISDETTSTMLTTITSAEQATKFQVKHPINWTADDVRDWMYFSAVVDGFDENNDIERGAVWDLRLLSGEKWQDIDGRRLCSMQLTEFIERDPHHGRLLYELLQRRLMNEPCGQMDDSDDVFDDLFAEDINQLFADERGFLPGISSFITDAPPVTTFTTESSSTDDTSLTYYCDFIGQQSIINCFEETLPLPTSDMVQPSKKPRQSRKQQRSTTKATKTAGSSRVQDSRGGHNRRRMSCSDSCSYTSDDACSGSEVSSVVDSSPITFRRKTKKRAVHLWQFMLTLLDDDRYNPGYVKWLNTSEGVFRIVNSAEIARLWGIKKNNRSMTFEKMSRSLRWSRDNGFLSDVPKNSGYPKKLCFRFGELADNWFNSPSVVSACRTR